MPLPAVGCCDPTDIDCASLYQLGDWYLANALDSLKVVRGDAGGCCDELIGYLTLGDGDDGITDAVTVAFRTITPSADQRGTIANVARFDVRLRESGWPMVNTDGGTVNMPDPVRQNALAGFVWAELEVMHRRFQQLQARHQLQPVGFRVVHGVLSPFRALNPSGGVVGGVVSLDITMPW